MSATMKVTTELEKELSAVIDEMAKRLEASERRCEELQERLTASFDREIQHQLAAKQPAASVDWEAMGELLRKEVYACGPIAWREDHIRAAKAVIEAYEASRAGEGKDGD